MKENKTLRMLLVLVSLLFLNFTDTTVQDTTSNNTPEIARLVYKFDIKQEIGPASWRITKQAFQEAKSIGAELIIIHMNTYGGLVQYADSIRTIVLNSPIPVYVFIDNNAASAGALISIACDRIYMRKGANIGAATVVNQNAEAAPDKYQSYMRKKMRSTAEAHGADTIINGSDTTIKWFRDPQIAEAMVDERIVIEGISKEGEVITFSTLEAIEHGYCDGIAEDVKEVMKLADIPHYEIKEHVITGMEKTIGFLVNPVFQGILIMVIVAGIYYELQTPGVGFPLAAAAIAAVVYFAPAYLEGLAENWEILLFVIGIILLAVEIFAIPGFGIAGIGGIILIVTGLTLAMVDNVVYEFKPEDIGALGGALLLVVSSMTISLFLTVYFSKKVLTTPAFSKLVLEATQENEKGFVGVDTHLNDLVGRTGIAKTDLRPSGRVTIDDEHYDAVSEIGFIEEKSEIKVIKCSSSQLYVIQKDM